MPKKPECYVCFSISNTLVEGVCEDCAQRILKEEQKEQEVEELWIDLRVAVEKLIEGYRNA